MFKIAASLFADMVVGIFKKMFMTNRDEEIGALKVINKDQGETIKDVKKVNDARADIQSGGVSLSDDPANRDNR